MGDSYHKCYGCEGFVYFTSSDRLMNHQIKTGHRNDQKSILRWNQIHDKRKTDQVK